MDTFLSTLFPQKHFFWILFTPMTKKTELGRRGENFACEYLVEKGYKLVEKNHREVWGELDLIMKAPDKTLVFVEVKTMELNFSQGLMPEDQMTFSKMQKFKKAASLYAGSHQNLINDKKGWRLDMIALTKNYSDFKIKHYQNII